ncbi:hypothetical protein Sme01_69150 [Sphaerisporangium melleum]|uniref:DUF4440 domain-containing protein n=2 Tax=Sphaerisporangium melleum TaxID=321316 RepID=A0A917RKU8_9ACTN|nr:hypothetical protein GCM10007964_63380 [Sphaerisporangium melleum]GII74439.1 hypothetical protein Sme01_69150 [Sphaerisporangium melleum]
MRLALAAGLGTASIGAAAPAATASPADLMTRVAVGASAVISPATPSSTDVAKASSPVSADSVQASAGTPADLTALARIRSRQESAWVRGDGRAYAAEYAPEADLVNILGEHLHGREGIATALQRYFRTSLRHTRPLVTEETVRFVSPVTAVIVRKGCVLYGAEKACRADTLSVNTSVAVKSGGEWLLTSFHNTLVRPPGRS